MAGTLTIVNPRRRRRARRAKARTRRRRRSSARAVAANPFRRRRRSSVRRAGRRRRRSSNPRIGGNIVGTLTRGLSLGFGAVAANVAANGVNNLLGANALTGPAKIAMKAAVGVIAVPMLLKFIPGGKKFAGSVALGAGIAVAFDIYDQWIKAALPAYLQDYEYGSLNAYRNGVLEGWAPQDGGMSGDAGGVYDGGVYS